MNLDTRSKRASSVGIALAFVLAPVLADGALSAGDRQHIAISYSGIAAQAPVAGDGASAGTSTVTGIGAAQAATVGTSSGTSTVTGISTALTDGVGGSAGSSTVTGISAALSESIGSSAGSSTVTGILQDGSHLVLPTADFVVRVSADARTVAVPADVRTVQI